MPSPGSASPHPPRPAVSAPEETAASLEGMATTSEARARARHPSRTSRAVTRFAPPVVGLIVLLLIWQFGVALLDIPSYLVPKPTDVVDAVRVNAGQLLEAVLRTMITSLIGLALAIVLGISAAVLLAFSRLVERSVFPYAIVLQTTPIVAIAPLIVIWIGPGPRAIIAISLIIAFFPMLSNTLTGLNSVDLEAKNLFRLYGASRWVTMWRLRLPGAMPYIMAGVRISGGLAVIGAIVGEFVAGIGGGRGGLGYVVQVASRQLNTPYLVAGALAGACLGVVYHIASRRLGRWLLSWHESTVEEEGELSRGSYVPAGAASGG
jgi:NitT/TauT family transport system permease protein